MDKYFTSDEAGKFIKSHSNIRDRFKSKAIAQSVINGCFEYQNLTHKKFITERPSQMNAQYKFYVNYDIFLEYAKNTIRNFFYNDRNVAVLGDKQYKYYYRSKTNQFFEGDRIVLGMAESMGLLSFTVENGNTPQIYMRINSIYPMEKAIKDPYYKNKLLDSIFYKHITSVEMLRYLFTYQVTGNNAREKIENYTNFFWSHIENYFLGAIPDEVQLAISKRLAKK